MTFGLFWNDVDFDNIVNGDSKGWSNRLTYAHAIESLSIRQDISECVDGSKNYWLWMFVGRDESKMAVWFMGDCAQTKMVSEEVLKYVGDRVAKSLKDDGFKVKVEYKKTFREKCQPESFHMAEFEFQLGSLEEPRERAYKYANNGFPFYMAPEGEKILKEEVHPKMQELADEVIKYPSEHIWHYCSKDSIDFLDGNYFPMAVDDRYVDEIRKMVDVLRGKFPTLKCRVNAENQKVGQLFYDKEHGKFEGPITRDMFDPFEIPVAWDKINV